MEKLEIKLTSALVSVEVKLRLSLAIYDHFFRDTTPAWGGEPVKECL